MTYNNSACVENALTALKKSFPNSLRSRKAMGIYSALVEATYFALDGHRRLQLDDNFAFSHRWRGNDIIANIASSIASTKENAVVILGQLLGLRPENVFHVFPAPKESSVVTVYDYHGRMLDSLPKALIVHGKSYIVASTGLIGLKKMRLAKLCVNLKAVTATFSTWLQ